VGGASGNRSLDRGAVICVTDPRAGSHHERNDPRELSDLLGKRHGGELADAEARACENLDELGEDVQRYDGPDTPLTSGIDQRPWPDPLSFRASA
jgi:hypothetical protein